MKMLFAVENSHEILENDITYYVKTLNSISHVNLAKMKTLQSYNSDF